MTQKDLIKQLNSLKEIKPRQEWVVFSKQQILGVRQESVVARESAVEKHLGILDILLNLSFQRKLAYSFAALFFVVCGVFGFAQNTMPGDALFSIKKITEQSAAALTGQTGLKYDFDNLNKRLEDLKQVAGSGKASNIPSAAQEVRNSMSQVAKNLKDNLPAKEDPDAIKEIVAEVKKIEDSQKQLQTLGVDIEETAETKELNDVLAPLVEREINDLEKSSLTEAQQTTLQEIKDLYNNEKYADALEKILMFNNLTIDES